MKPLTLETASVAATLACGEALGRELAGGDLVLLSGGLGSGKTHLAKGIALGLGVPADVVVASPTFVLVREYAGRCRLAHSDWYRLGEADEVAALGLEEVLATGGVVVVEWADRFPEADLAGAATWRVTCEAPAAERRRYKVACDDPARLTDLADAVREWR